MLDVDVGPERLALVQNCVGELLLDHIVGKPLGDDWQQQWVVEELVDVRSFFGVFLQQRLDDLPQSPRIDAAKKEKSQMITIGSDEGRAIRW